MKRNQQIRASFTDSRKVLIQKHDTKSIMWSEAGKTQGLTFVPQPGSSIRAPLFLLRFMISEEVPTAYVVRYLNDYPSAVKTLLRLCSELLLVSLCLACRVKLCWICHNVDKESSRNHPRLSNLRRKLFARFAERIFVTDELLIPHARRVFPKHSKKIECISFGEPIDKEVCDIESEGKAIDFIKKKRKTAKEKNMQFFTFLCAGSPNSEKCLHFDYLTELIRTAERDGIYIAAIVAGAFDSSSRSSRLSREYLSNSNVCLFQSYTEFSNSFIKENIDFYWRGYRDYSVPFTVYEAAAARKPILALKSGFLEELIDNYRIGATVDASLENLPVVFNKLRLIQETDFTKFLVNHSWQTLPKKLAELV